MNGRIIQEATSINEENQMAFGNKMYVDHSTDSSGFN